METSDEERREVAARLRELDIHDWYDCQDEIDSLESAIECNVGQRFESHSWWHRLADLVEPCPIDGETSDGYHTFNELYHHRAVLFSVIVATFGERAWKSKLHTDGTMYDGMFIVGIDTPDGQATYHYDIDPYWDLFRCAEIKRAPEWDGHTPNQAIERIGKLADLVDRPTCRNVDHADEYGFVFSQCGSYAAVTFGTPYDEYRRRIAEASVSLGLDPREVERAVGPSGTRVPWFCPSCGAKVVHDA